MMPVPVPVSQTAPGPCRMAMIAVMGKMMTPLEPCVPHVLSGAPACCEVVATIVMPGKPVVQGMP
jgi:hypothetical protein